MVNESKQKIIDAVALLVNSHNDNYILTATVEIPMNLPIMPERGDLPSLEEHCKQGYNGECCITIKRTLKPDSAPAHKELDTKGMRENAEAIKQAIEFIL